MKIGNKKIGRRQLRRIGWILISILAVFSMLLLTVAPYFGIY